MKLQDYQPRSVFLPLHNRSKRWATVVAHRRAGKTVAMCADIVIGALETALQRPQFAYLAPFRAQAKMVAWSYLKELTKDFWAKPPNESELKLSIRNGHGGESTIYVAGADNPDALRGLYFDGVVLDEVGDMRPSAWYTVIRPALSDRRGWAIFAGTPRGKNLFWNLREEARLNPSSHILLELPASKTGIIHPDELRDAKAQMTPEAYETEYEISFEAAIPGAYYAKLIGDAYAEGRIGKHTIDPELKVNLVADLGYTDSCSWWGWQETHDGIRIVDFMEDDNQPIQHYIDWIKSRPYTVNPKGIWLPHDARAKSLQTGKSIIEQFLANGIRPNLVPEMSLQDGIEAARLTIPTCYFDEEACYEGLEHLRAYMREWDEKTQTYRNRPKHDQHSHGADSFRYLALAARPVSRKSHRAPTITTMPKSMNYGFALNDIWDCRPRESGRIE
uniref:Terminase large subunit n=1 Tax=Heunggongvirae sp. TaxID=2795755 RepID=A0A890UQ57_9VIRU|nr:MAG: terminase large subunit [Heunggongvirae sp.]